jgi:Ig-like domain CHU_C associated/von Willebrand factor type A domain
MATLRARALGVVAAVLLGVVFAAPAHAQQCGPMDVVFIIDETGSMTNVINQVQTQVVKIADAVEVASGGDFQFALVGMPDNNIDVIENLSSDRAAFNTATTKLVVAGGCGGVPYDEAINAVVNTLGARTGSSGAQLNAFTGGFRSQAAKIVILITDTLPQAFTCQYVAGTHDVAAHNFAAQAAAADIHITAVYVPTGNVPESEIIRIMQDVAATSSGLFKQTKPDASDLSDIIVDIVNQCGGAAGAGSQNLILDPTEIFASNLETVDVKSTLYLPAPADKVTTYTASGLPEDSTVQFLPRTPDVEGTEARTVRITIGPDTPAGTYVLTVKASRDDIADQFDYVLVFVDCQPPFILGVNDLGTQSQSVTSGTRANLKVVPGGNGPYKYQWFQGHSGSTAFPISGATQNTLQTPPITAASEFWVRVTNACGSRDSATATVSPR